MEKIVPVKFKSKLLIVLGTILGLVIFLNVIGYCSKTKHKKSSSFRKASAVAFTSLLPYDIDVIPANPYIVNIGAHRLGSKEGEANYDPVAAYLSFDSSRGFAIDPKEGLNDWVGSEVQTFTGFATPTSIVTEFKNADVLSPFSFLKVDIDGYDAAVVKAILLKGYQPLNIKVEINAKVPPPIVFCLAYSTTWNYQGDHFYGCSLQGWVDLLGSMGYTLSAVKANDAWFTFHGKGIDVREAYSSGYVSVAKKDFPWNSNVHFWNDLPSDGVAQLNAVKKFMMETDTFKANDYIVRDDTDAFTDLIPGSVYLYKSSTK